MSAVPPDTTPGAGLGPDVGPAEMGEARTLRESVHNWWVGVRSGELGSLPIILGLIIIAVVFQSQNSNFLTAPNFVNLIVQMAPIAVIGMGIVFVLLLGEIDLSVGYVSGVAGVVTALLLNPDGNELPVLVVIPIALLCGASIGTLHGLLITKIGIPSFVVTLAGLLAWNGVVLLLIGDAGTVTVQNDLIIGFANDFLSPLGAWIVMLGSVAVYAIVELVTYRSRTKKGLPNEPVSVMVLKVAFLAAVGTVVVAVANQDRGVPYVGVLLIALLIGLTFVTDRIKFGRYVYAVGGNKEASRRAGIGTDRITIAVFAMCSTMAALGGIVLASRLRSVDTNAGGGSILLYSIAAAVIGGTSLFGGRGTIRSALLGALVIASIDNGLGLLNVGAGQRFVITGLVLLAAVTVDSLSRRGREQSGRA